LADLILPRIDLNRHVGVHPRIGALDVCPIVVPPGEDPTDAEIPAQALVQDLGRLLAEQWDLPVFLYEKSERGRHEADLPSLRRGGFGGMLDRDLQPDFGPPKCHPTLGVAVMGVRDFLIAMNVNLATPSPKSAMALAKMARRLRQEGDPRFLGVRALGVALPSRNMSQVSFNLTLPDITSADAIVEWVRGQKTGLDSTELVGVVRQTDLPRLTRFSVSPEQVVD
jgi:glutamate formiminotransferase